MKNETPWGVRAWMALLGKKHPTTLLEATLHNRREDWLVHTLASGEATQALYHAAVINSQLSIAGVG